MTTEKTQEVFRKVSELVTRVQKGSSKTRVVVYPKTGPNHYSVRIERETQHGSASKSAQK